MFCTNCGAALPNGADICPNCNRPVSRSSFAQGEVPVSNVNYNGQNAPYKPESCNQNYNSPSGNTNGFYGSQQNNPVNSTYNAPVNGAAYQQNRSEQYNQYSQNGGAYNPQAYRNPDEKANVGLCVASVFFPIVGLILFLVQKNDTPRAAKSYLLCAAISFGVQVLLSIIVMVIMWTAVWAAVPYIDDSFSYDYDYDYDTATNLFTALISPVKLFFMK